MKEFIRRLKARPGLAIELIVASLFVNVLGLAIPLFVIQVLNRYVAHGVDATLATLATGALIAVFLEFGFRQVRIRLARAINVRHDAELSAAAFKILTNARIAAIERLSPAQRREVLSGSDSIAAAYNANNMTAVIDVPFALLFIFVLSLLAPSLAGVVFAFVSFAFISGVTLTGVLRAPTQQLSQETRSGTMLMGTAIQDTDTIRAFNAGGFLRRAWDLQATAIRALQRRIVNLQGLMMSTTQGLTGVQSIAIYSTGALLIVHGHLDVGALIGANILGSRALQPVARFAQMGEAFAKARQSLAQLREFMNLPQEPESGSVKRSFSGDIEFRDIGFAFPGASSPLFESLSVHLPPGSTLVVSGGNGTGKTTLARLLTGIIEPSRGQFLIDGLELRQTQPGWWRRQIIYLPQEPTFLNATIEENLSVLNPEITPEEMGRAIEAAGVRQFLDESPKGLGSMIAGNGQQLALGIRRRLALARALTTDGMVAIFDEPTEGMDMEGAAAIYRVMNDLHKRGRTIIAFSHDPNIVKGAQFFIDLNAKPVPRVGKAPQPVTTERPVGQAERIAT